VGGGSVLTSLLAFTALYGLLAVIDGYLMLKVAQAGPVDDEEGEELIDPATAMSF
jgi:cytochrome d ubiquinol oxidase subunit I